MTTNVPADNDHAFYNPSGASIWMNCTGFAAIKHKAPKQETTEYALEGTEAHKWVDKISSAKTTSIRNALFRQLEQENKEMFFYVNQYAKFLDETAKKFFKDATEKHVHGERKVKFSKDNWGTLDRSFVRLKEGRLEAAIFDFKYGKGVPVSAEKNLQLINYFLALDNEYGNAITRAWLYIYQPRTEGEPLSRYCIEKDEKKEWKKQFTSRLKVLEDVRNGVKEAEYHAGDWCRFCPAASICPQLKYSLKKEALTELDKTAPIIPQVKSLSLEQRVNIFKHRKLFAKFIVAIEQDLQARVKAGLAIKGLKLIHGRSNRRWKANIEKIAEAIEKHGLDPWKRELIGITQAEKVLGKTLIEKMTFKPEGRLQLVADDDTRESEAIDELPDLE